MSIFIHRLNQLAESAPQAMGFRTSQMVSPKYRIQLVAHLMSAETKYLADLGAADAFTVPMTGSNDGREIQDTFPQIPCGGWLTKSQISLKAGASQFDPDFLIFSTGSSLGTIPDNETIGKILEVPPCLDDGLLSAINPLPVDAVLITSGETATASVTWYDLMSYQRFAGILSKPLLVLVPSGVSGDELQVMWQVGIIGIVMVVDTAESAAKLKELHREIDQLKFPAPYQQRNISALLPRSQVIESKAYEESDE